MSEYFLVTGCAGFIGFHLCKQLIEDRYKVIGIDNINDYYDTKLKKKRLKILSQTSLNTNNWEFFKTDLDNKDSLLKIFQKYKPETVINLAAQAGVRYSLENPGAYISSNIIGFITFWNAAKIKGLKFYMQAVAQFMEVILKFILRKWLCDHPVSIYAATEINELMAHSYSHLYEFHALGWDFHCLWTLGKIDMAPMIFADAINKKTLKIFNHGNMSKASFMEINSDQFS